MSFSRIFALACVSSTVFSIAVGAAMFRSGSVEITSPSPVSQEAFLPGEKGHLLISGHSLTDEPFPEYFSGIASDSGIAVLSKAQNASGSSIRDRMSGKFPRPGIKPYDLLVITEQHRLLDSLVWQDTVGSLYAFHSDFVAANPAAVTYFYSPWISLSDRTDPAEWISYERQALPVWRCVVRRANDRIAAMGRQDRIRFIPASLALAELVDRLISDPIFSGFEAMGGTERIDAIFADDVHLTPLGAYYVAAVSFAAVYGREMGGLSLPEALDQQRAFALRSFAEEFVKNHSAQASGDARNCDRPVTLAFASRYAGYTARTYHTGEKGYVRAQLKRVGDTIRFAWRFRNGLGDDQIQ
jgi:hypothetical protein